MKFDELELSMFYPWERNVYPGNKILFESKIIFMHYKFLNEIILRTLIIIEVCIHFLIVDRISRIERFIVFLQY